MNQTAPIDAFIRRFSGRGNSGVLSEGAATLAPGQQTPAGGSFSNELAQLIQSLSQQTKAVGDNTTALGQSTQSVESMGNSILSFARSSIPALASKSGGLFSFNPLVSLISGLFRRNEEQPAVEPAKIEMPDPIQWDLGAARTNGSVVRPVVYGEQGLPKSQSTPSQGSTNQVTVNIQAMDARSFLDRSSEIASALKSALLHSSSLNDVMAEME